MNNKSDKKHKRSQKKPRTKKKTASHQSKKKKEIKRGGVWPSSSIRSFFSKEYNSRKSNQTVSQNPQLANPNNPQRNVSQNPQLANSKNSQPPPPPPPPNAQPQGFNTLKAQSRCSIL